ncbi:hypothetical protein MOQ_002614 [Trypanosoma cruzi marinkellei]|uniref:Uncharacterized protein n=1 Tax=Trypanosoma cruzi marinkellei TaxID=85056 RepID=K2NF18_TRYCR|nr:hypothetical protein MOQ_002614 [Trypanosoma cruzi marinkellei]
MRRCVSAAATSPTAAFITAWRGGAPATGALVTWRCAYFHSSRFLGRKSGGSKKLGAGASINTTTGASSLPSSPVTNATTGASGEFVGNHEGTGGGNDAAVKATAKEHQTTASAASSPPTGVSPPTASVDASASINNKNTNNDGRASFPSSATPSGKGSAATMKKTRVPQRRKSVQNSEECAASPETVNDTMRFSKKEPTNMNRLATDGVVSVEPDEEDVVVERASITKLFMLSDSVASIFCALPQNQRSIDNYLREVDQAVLPPSASDHRTGGTGTVMHGDGGYTGQSKEAVARREIAERVLSEERANHTLCIHVRDMDQLVPPPDLLLNSTANELTKTATTGGARRRKVLRKEKKPDAVNKTSLTPIERILALHEWQVKALERARGSQERFKVPDDYHAITRVRFHDPPKADLTVVQGSGCGKTVADVLATMNRGLNNNDMNADDHREQDIFDDNETLDDESGATLLSKPFAIKPLLSVVASCIPRREPALGSRCGEETFFSSGAPYSSSSSFSSSNTAVTTARKAKRSKRNDSEAKKTADSAKMGVELLGHRVPPMPRFTTRVTVLVEHDELEPVDLLSMAERSTTRKDDVDNKKSVSRKKRVPRIYCHIADGGEY